MLRWASVLLIAALASPAFAAPETPEDAYAACVIGKAAVLIYHSADVPTAATAAWAECKALEPPGLTEQDGEGLSDFVYMILEDIAGTNERS